MFCSLSWKLLRTSLENYIACFSLDQLEQKIKIMSIMSKVNEEKKRKQKKSFKQTFFF